MNQEEQYAAMILSAYGRVKYLPEELIKDEIQRHIRREGITHLELVDSNGRWQVWEMRGSYIGVPYSTSYLFIHEAKKAAEHIQYISGLEIVIPKPG